MYNKTAKSALIATSLIVSCPIERRITINIINPPSIQAARHIVFVRSASKPNRLSRTSSTSNRAVTHTYSSANTKSNTTDGTVSGLVSAKRARIAAPLARAAARAFLIICVIYTHFNAIKRASHKKYQQPRGLLVYKRKNKHGARGSKSARKK